MSIRLTKKVGFCFGVKRAVEMAEEVLKKEGEAHSLGSIIHNTQVVKDLSRKGLKVIDSIDDAASGCIVISSHGISPHVADKISKRSLKLVDTTCPFVSNAQRKARSLSSAGYKVIIVGDVNHPEVKALVDFARQKAYVVKDALGIKRLRINPRERIGVLSQTTQSMDNFIASVGAIIEKKPKELKIVNTICKDAEERQGAAQKITRKVDLMLIVGGKNSANTKRLFDVCKKILSKSYLVETEADLRSSWFKMVRAVGITSGASTPDWIVRRVAGEVKKKMNPTRKFQRKEGCKR
ncbi:MAG: 4-hydroxy-3-methylbut-2-enyl diphosphate reductase [Omnitrophica bacterium RIFCSPHIGHO2_02_FULL_46_20]|nr:MAG: 4-hydroxy-3-methylbut-2-enyl diphosphate reductase [Omnitrophica bacterium RIFCSPHIGHO2_02_FULL_46_20]OGW94547.1 MAG: 4-hydroxy-3-methylbut-2-enyl diphosphate reductase [Omnitrophica bacterium RIFCSPLOWO2_12_FULL_45_13]